LRLEGYEVKNVDVYDLARIVATHRFAQIMLTDVWAEPLFRFCGLCSFLELLANGWAPSTA
jgi:hypothetical protein